MTAQLTGLLVTMTLLQAGDPKHDTTSPDATQVLLIGTFHFSDPGRDVVKTKSFDVLTDQAQADLEDIASRIAAFGPTRIFVEYPYDKQDRLDDLYARYVADELFNDPDFSESRRRNEIYQLAFRAAKKLGLKKVHAVDYTNTDFPYESVLKAIHEAGQQDLKADLDAVLKEHAAEMNNRIESDTSLQEILSWMNSRESIDESVAIYLELFARAGKLDDFEGPRLVSEWYRRNLYIWSLIQKQTTESDERIMVLFGAGHVAVFDQLLRPSKEWKVIEWNDVVQR